MSNIKASLDSLIKTGSKFGFPSANNKVALNFTTYNKWSGWYTPPKDGWLVYIMSGCNFVYVLNLTGTLCGSSHTCNNYSQVGSFPVKKGTSVQYYLASGANKQEFYFIPNDGAI